jgi:hypothetical protein
MTRWALAGAVIYLLQRVTGKHECLPEANEAVVAVECLPANARAQGHNIATRNSG